MIHKNKKDFVFELYNLIRDPDEKENLIDTETMIAEKLKAKMKKWQVSVLRSLNGKDY